MGMIVNTLTVEQALAAGYTHFWFSSPSGANGYEFVVYELSKGKLTWAFKMCNDQEFDDACSEEDMENYFGYTPVLCMRPESPQVTAEQVVDKIGDIFEDDDRFVPALLHTMSENLSGDDKFKEGIALINAAMNEYRSYTDAGIFVTLQ